MQHLCCFIKARCNYYRHRVFSLYPHHDICHDGQSRRKEHCKNHIVGGIPEEDEAARIPLRPVTGGPGIDTIIRSTTTTSRGRRRRSFCYSHPTFSLAAQRDKRRALINITPRDSPSHSRDTFRGVYAWNGSRLWKRESRGVMFMSARRLSRWAARLNVGCE